MANHKSAIKRIRQITRRTEVNKHNGARLRSQVKSLLKAVEAGENEKATELLSPTVSLIDKSVQKGVIKKGKADRMKSRLTLRVGKVTKAA